MKQFLSLLIRHSGDICDCDLFGSYGPAIRVFKQFGSRLGSCASWGVLVPADSDQCCSRLAAVTTDNGGDLVINNRTGSPGHHPVSSAITVLRDDLEPFLDRLSSMPNLAKVRTRLLCQAR